MTDYRHADDCAVHEPVLRPCSCGLETQLRSQLTALTAGLSRKQGVIRELEEVALDWLAEVDNNTTNKIFRIVGLNPSALTDSTRKAMAADRAEIEKGLEVNPKVAQLHEEIEQHLNEIAPLFVRGVRLTFIARLPGKDEADVVLTIDDLDEVIKVLERSKPREGKTP